MCEPGLESKSVTLTVLFTIHAYTVSEAPMCSVSQTLDVLGQNAHAENTNGGNGEY